MPKFTIADVLHLAADKYLIADTEDTANFDKEHYSCCAIHNAIAELAPKEFFDNQGFRIFYTGEANETPTGKRVFAGLKAMGLDPGSTQLFKKLEKKTYGGWYNLTPESQGARYSWLKFAAMIAEEQGV